MAITQTITAAPPAPSRDDPANFAEKGNNFVAWQEGFPTEINTWSGEANSVAAAINSDKANAEAAVTDCQAAVTQAEAARDAAASYANVTVYAAGTEYDAGDVVQDPGDNYKLYTSQQAGNVGHTPNSDDGTWWVKSVLAEILAPAITSPADGSTGIGLSPEIIFSQYYSLYGKDQAALQVQISDVSDFATTIDDETLGAVSTYTTSTLSTLSTYYARGRYQDVSGMWSVWTPVISFTTSDILIQTPTATSPADSATDIGETPTLEADAFACINGSDTHASSSWQVATDSGFSTIIYESLEDASNLESITIPSGTLDVSTQYYWRVKYTGTTYGDSDYSTSVSFTTKDAFELTIGTAGGEGFGVAPAYYDVSSIGLAEMTGTTTLGHDNYGNYIHTATNSILCHVPKFFYRVGNSSSPQYATYGANALDIAGTDVYATEAEANTAGYAMPRAFIDGGAGKDGFFIDKYKCSPADNNKGVSVKNGVPLGLSAASSDYTNSGGMTGCDGKFYDAVTLSRARGAGFNNASVFMMGAIAILSVAHAQAATADTYCAWYDSAGTTNFPKGCNDNALGDTNDDAVTYTTAGDSGNANKPLTGSGAPFAKTTHNGQNCGICDLNGGMYEVAIGVTNYGTSATATTAISNDNIYILKQSVAIKDLTAGWDGTNDVWGDTTHMGTLYDSVTSPHALGSTTGVVYWGSGSNAVFSADTSGVSRDLCGFVPKDNSASDATGTNQFGNDYCNRYNRQNMYVLCCGYWNSAATAGLFYRGFSYSRSNGNYACGFRACAYV